jgi:hypothetical protein
LSSLTPAVPVEIRNQVEVEGAASDLETNPRARITVEQQLAVAQHSVNQVEWCVVQDDQLHDPPQLSFEIALQTQLQILKPP